MLIHHGAVYRQAAKVKQDTEVQRYASELYEKFIRIISSRSGMAKMSPFPQERLRRKMERGMALDASYLDPSLDDLDIILTHRPDHGQGHLGAGGYVNKNRDTGRYEMVLGPDLYGDYELPFNKKEEARGYFGISTFSHEFTHYLDVHRWKGTGEKGIFTGDEPEESEEEARGGEGFDPKYYNSPLEFNAFFQEGAARLNSHFELIMAKKAALRNRELKKFTQPFEDFASYAKGWFRREFVYYLNEKYQRAFLKRLYNLYVQMKQRAEEVLSKSRTAPYVPQGPPLIFPQMRNKPRSPHPKVYEGRSVVAQKNLCRIELKCGQNTDNCGEEKGLPGYTTNRWEDVVELAKAHDLQHDYEARLDFGGGCSFGDAVLYVPTDVLEDVMLALEQAYLDTHHIHLPDDVGARQKEELSEHYSVD